MENRNTSVPKGGGGKCVMTSVPRVQRVHLLSSVRAVEEGRKGQGWREREKEGVLLIVTMTMYSSTNSLGRERPSYVNEKIRIIVEENLRWWRVAGGYQSRKVVVVNVL